MHLSADALLCMGVANVHLSFRVALVMSALAMAITIWEKLEGEWERDNKHAKKLSKAG